MVSPYNTSVVVLEVFVEMGKKLNLKPNLYTNVQKFSYLVQKATVCNFQQFTAAVPIQTGASEYPA